MEKTFSLEIDRMWRPWRGDLHDYYNFSTTRRPDPMDRCDYNESSAFPMHKPNFDVFGIPRRTRKQRGWYQVRHHPKARPERHICILPTPPALSAVTGADLPIELVRLIGKMMTRITALQWDKDDDKRTMMACALVCRYWASQFLPKIFHKILIISRQRALALWEFDRSPKCWFHRFVKPRVTLKIENLLQLSCVHLLTRHKQLNLALIGPLPRGWKTIRSIHQALPHSVPRSLSSSIEILCLGNVHFQRFSDFVHLVCELPDLHCLQWAKVTWGPLPARIGTVSRRRTKGSSRRGLVIRLSSSRTESFCTEVQAAVHILAHVLSRNGHPCLSTQDLSAVVTLAPLIDTLCVVALTPDGANTRSFKSNVKFGWMMFSNSRSSRYSLELKYEGGSAFYVQAPIHTGPNGEDVVSDVTDVTVDLSFLSDHRAIRWSAFDWQELDKRLSTLRSARLVFAFRTGDHMLTFVDEVADSLMPLASARGSISYAIQLKPTYQGWYQAFRDSDILQGPPTSLMELYNPPMRNVQ